MKNKETPGRIPKAPENARKTPGNGTPTPGPIVGRDCARVNLTQLRLFLYEADKVTDPETLADLLEALTRQHAGAVNIRVSDGGRIVNSANPARILEAIRATLADGTDPANGKRWADRFPGVVSRLNDNTRIDGPTIYARVLARFRPVEGQTPAGMENTSTGTVYALTSNKTPEQLRGIFSALVGAGYIDGSGPESLPDFLRAFDPGAGKQGRIIWTRRAKSHALNKMALCDFLYLHGVPAERWHEYAAAIFGVEVSKSTISNAATGSADRGELQTLLDG